ncbi:MAG: SDR family NAD(P)-dependent oxidoreductase [Candidatus Dormibacteria bacterium]
MAGTATATATLPSMRVDGQVAVVTGAGSGLGRAFALALAEAGADVVITELPGREKSAQEVAGLVAERGRRQVTLPLDVTSVDSIEHMIEAAERDFGPVDIIVNNAGINITQPTLEVTEEAWDRVLDTNLKGVFFCAQRAARRMARRGHGKIINIASQNGLVGYQKRAAYCSAKGGVVNLTRLLAVELAPRNIQVNCVAPTFVFTALTEPMFEDQDFKQDVLSKIPLGRIATPEEVVGAVVFLASPAADMITGHTMLVDGGWTAQ